MKLNDKTVLVTGANRGIGRALVESLLKHPVKKVYASARSIDKLPAFGDARVVPMALDITDPKMIMAAAALASDTDILINNAGVLTMTGFPQDTDADLKHDMEVNYFGTMRMVHAFVPVLTKRGGGAIANVISVAGLAGMSDVVGYSASKAALLSATQSMRASLKDMDISVHGIFPGPIDTDMAKGFDMQKATPQATADAILVGITAGDEDIFPDPMSLQIGQLWRADPKAVEKQFAAM